MRREPVSVCRSLRQSSNSMAVRYRLTPNQELAARFIFAFPLSTGSRQMGTNEANANHPAPCAEAERRKIAHRDSNYESHQRQTIYDSLSGRQCWRRGNVSPHGGTGIAAS